MNIEQALDLAVDVRDSPHCRPRDKVETALILLAEQYKALHRVTIQRAERASNPPIMAVPYNVPSALTTDEVEALIDAASVDDGSNLIKKVWLNIQSGNEAIDLAALVKAINEHFKVK